MIGTPSSARPARSRRSGRVPHCPNLRHGQFESPVVEAGLPPGEEIFPSKEPVLEPVTEWTKRLRHGMTVGEMARCLIGETASADLHGIEMKNW